MSLVAVLSAIYAFVVAHWQSGVIVATAGGGLYAALRNRAYGLFLKLALEMVRQVAVEELSGPEKRKKVVEEVLKITPAWAKKYITAQQAEVIAERAYQLLRGELKAAEQLSSAKEFVDQNSVDPTKPIVDAENLHVKAPIDIKE